MTIANWRTFLLAAMAGIALAACGGEDAAAPAASSGSGSGSSSSPPTTAPSQTQTPPNAAPAISGTPASAVVAGTTYMFQPTATDADGDTLSFSATGLPSWAAIDTATGMVYGTPAESDVGTTADIVITASDGQAGASLPAFQITINSALPPPTTPPPTNPPANQAPTISGSPATTVQASSAYSFTPTAVDPEGQRLTFSIANKPSWAAFSTTTGRLSGTPSASNVRTFSNILISVSDGSLSTSLPAFSITVTAAPNRAPTISGTPATSVAAGSAYSFTPTGSDPDGQTLTYSIANKPSWAAFSTSTGRLSGTPSSSNVGTFSNIRISVSDGSLSASLPEFAITVTSANRAPSISGTPSTSVVTGSAYSFTPTASDPDGDTLAFSITGKPAWATFSTATGALTGTPTAAQAGSYPNIVITVSDGKVSQALPAFTITATQPGGTGGSGTAVLSWSAPAQNTDGSALTDLAGYKVYHGTSATSLTDVVQLNGSGTTSYTFTQLSSGTHYFAVSAYNASGVESAKSAVGSKTIP